MDGHIHMLNAPPGSRAISTHAALRYHVLSVVILAVGLFLTALAFNSVRNEEQLAVKEAFLGAVETHVSEISQGLAQSIQLVRSVKAHLQATDYVSRENFRAFVQPLLTQYPGVQAMEWIPRVSAENRDKYEKDAQRDFPGFRITERLEQGAMVPAKPRPEFFPVYYVEPYKGNEPALGFDMGSSPTRLEVLSRAWDTGNIVATPRVILVQEKAEQFGFLVFNPLYRNHSSTLEERRANLLGFVLGVFRIKDVVETAISHSKPLGLDLTIYDKSADSSKSILYTHLSRTGNSLPPSEAAGPNLDSDLSYAEDLDISGRTWVLKFTPARGFYVMHTSVRVWALLLVGVAGTLVLVAYVQVMRRHEQALTISEGRLAGAQRIAHLGNWVWNIQEDRVTYSDEAYRIFGKRPQAFGTTYATFLESVHPDDKASVMRSIDQAITTKTSFSIDHRIVLPDGTVRFVHEQGEVVTDAWGNPVRIFGIVRDITERRRTEEQLRSASLYARSLIEASLDPLVTISLEGKITDLNEAATAVTGVPRNLLMGMDFSVYFTDPDKARAIFQEALTKGFVTNYPLTMRHMSGKLTEVLYNASVYHNEKGEAAGVAVKARDISERRRAEQAEELASRDSLTELYNHRTFYALLNDEVVRAQRYNRPVSLLMLDIDHFKRVNDSYGHPAGDAILKGLSGLLMKQARTIDRVCRYGGEEFTVILTETEAAAAINIAERLRAAVECQSFDIGGGKVISVTVSIGVAAYPQHVSSQEELVKASDIALYAAKQGGRNRVRRYEPEMVGETPA